MDVCPAVVSALEGKDCREVMKSIADSSPIPQEKLSHIIAGMYRILSEAIRIPTTLLKQEVSCYIHPAGHPFTLSALFPIVSFDLYMIYIVLAIVFKDVLHKVLGQIQLQERER